MQEIKNYS